VRQRFLDSSTPHRGAFTHLHTQIVSSHDLDQRAWTSHLEKAAKQAVSDLGIDATFEKVTDYADIASYGIMRTPGLVVDEQVVLSGRVPTAAQVKELIAPLA